MQNGVELSSRQSYGSSASSDSVDSVVQLSTAAEEDRGGGGTAGRAVTGLQVRRAGTHGRRLENGGCVVGTSQLATAVVDDDDGVSSTDDDDDIECIEDEDGIQRQSRHCRELINNTTSSSSSDDDNVAV